MAWLQALHAMCLAHFEEDQAAGGNLYAKFARCYLQLSGAKPDQHKTKAQPHQALSSDQVSCILTFHSGICFGASGWLPCMFVLPLNACVQRGPMASIAGPSLVQAVMMHAMKALGQSVKSQYTVVEKFEVFQRFSHAPGSDADSYKRMRLPRSGQATAKLCCFSVGHNAGIQNRHQRQPNDWPNSSRGSWGRSGGAF